MDFCSSPRSEGLGWAEATPLRTGWLRRVKVGMRGGVGIRRHWKKAQLTENFGSTFLVPNVDLAWLGALA